VFIQTHQVQMIRRALYELLICLLRTPLFLAAVFVVGWGWRRIHSSTTSSFKIRSNVWSVPNSDNETFADSPSSFPLQILPPVRSLPYANYLTITYYQKKQGDAHHRAVSLVRSTGALALWRVVSSAGELQRPSQQAQSADCEYATNGGPFHFVEGTSVGPVLQNGAWLSRDFGGSNVRIGRILKPQPSWIIVTLQNDSQAENWAFSIS